MFSFDLKESGDLCRQILEYHKVAPDALDQVLAHWQSAKEPLLRCLGPTGRVEMPSEMEVTPKYRHDTYYNAISQVRMELPSSLEKACLDYLSEYFPTSWITDGCIEAGKTLRTREESVKIPKGQKLTRAVAAYLRACGLDNDRASVISELVMRGQNVQQKGTLVLSVNPVDLLLTGEHGSFTTCHALTGSRKSGNYQYLIDAQTAVAYFYMEPRRHRDLAELPWKLWRQLVVFDIPQRAIGFCRHYPDTLIADEQHKKIRERCARIMTQITGTSADWVVTRNLKVYDFASNQLTAYIDVLTMVMTAGAYRIPQLTLPTPLCPGCAKLEHYVPHDRLCCTACLNASKPCTHCKTPTKHDKTAILYRDIRPVCGKCVAQHYRPCPSCHITTSKSDMVHGVCPSCHITTSNCNRCDKRTVGYVCERCRGITGTITAPTTTTTATANTTVTTTATVDPPPF